MNWLTVADRAQTKKCDESRKYGRCNCGSGRKANPCEKLEVIRQSAVNLDIGEPAELTVHEIQKWASYQTCAKSRDSRSCNHKACLLGEQIVDWLAEQTIVTIPATRDREAA